MRTSDRNKKAASPISWLVVSEQDEPWLPKRIPSGWEIVTLETVAKGLARLRAGARVVVLPPKYFTGMATDRGLRAAAGAARSWLRAGSRLTLVLPRRHGEIFRPDAELRLRSMLLAQQIVGEGLIGELDSPQGELEATPCKAGAELAPSRVGFRLWTCGEAAHGKSWEDSVRIEVIGQDALGHAVALRFAAPKRQGRLDLVPRGMLAGDLEFVNELIPWRANLEFTDEETHGSRRDRARRIVRVNSKAVPLPTASFAMLQSIYDSAERERLHREFIKRTAERDALALIDRMLATFEFKALVSDEADTPRDRLAKQFVDGLVPQLLMFARKHRPTAAGIEVVSCGEVGWPECLDNESKRSSATHRLRKELERSRTPLLRPGSKLCAPELQPWVVPCAARFQGWEEPGVVDWRLVTENAAVLPIEEQQARTFSRAQKKTTRRSRKTN